MNQRGRYLFAVATGLDSEALTGQEGIDGQPLQIVDDDGLQAVVCDVDLAEFGEEPVRQNLERLRGESRGRSRDRGPDAPRHHLS